MPAFAPLLDLQAQDRRWYVVRSKARKEDYAVQQLERRGVRVFLPRILEWGHDEVAPLFPGYLFVCIALLEQYYRVSWPPGVGTFGASGAAPAPSQDGAIAFTVRAGVWGGTVRPSRPSGTGPGAPL